MTRPLFRRNILLGAAALSLIACGATGGSMTVTPVQTGTLTYSARKAIPEGRIVLLLEDTADPSAAQPTVLTLDSDGTAERLDFTLPAGALPAAMDRAGVEMVAYLERADGWKIARGSVELPWADPVVIDLATMMY